ncbi:MAG: HipA domain-containing protein [Myxococcales bacterium]|nr:HipA domain-containing protein [Myxococcales bacterium]
MTAYTPADTLYLWMLADPRHPVLIGELNVVRSLRGVSLRYAASWREHGFALSEDLPLWDSEFMPKDKDTAAGAVDDARPDRWGERIIRFIDKPSRLSLMEYLYFAGDDRFGALGVSTSATAYLPRKFGPLPNFADIVTIEQLVQRVLANEPIPAAQQRLIVPGVTMGGARPKALVEIDGAPWVVKFADGDAVDTPLIEHAAMSLARQAGIRTATTRAIRLADGHAVAVKRFDRLPQGRVHALSAHVALRAAGERFGYPELAQVLRRRADANADAYADQMRELFRRMVFNILIDNTDDHEKNHVLLVTATQHYELSPAFDVLPSGQALGYQQMRVGTAEADATLDNAMSMYQAFALKKDAAAAEVRQVIAAVATWQPHFAACGVSQSDLALLAEQIDRPFLKQQRDNF